jgi:TrmH family RNA methyltransferase
MKLDDVKKLHQKKYRSQMGHYLVEGEHLILELQKAAKQRIDLQRATLFIAENYQGSEDQFDAHFERVSVNKKQMAQISDTKTPQGIIACVPLPKSSTQKGGGEQRSLKNGERCIYLHEVQDPGNLGTILRSLAWFGNFRLLLSPNSVDPFNPKVVRSSMGAIFHVPIELEVELNDLHQRFKKFAYLDMHGEKVNTTQFANYECYLFGNEARGVPKLALSACNAAPFTIEGCGTIDSLNLASAVNICVYQLSV